MQKKKFSVVVYHGKPCRITESAAQRVETEKAPFTFKAQFKRSPMQLGEVVEWSKTPDSSNMLSLYPLGFVICVFWSTM